MKKISDLPPELLQFLTTQDVEYFNMKYAQHCERCEVKGTSPVEKESYLYDAIMRKCYPKFKKHYTNIKKEESEQLSEKWKDVNTPKSFHERLNSDVMYKELLEQRSEKGWGHNRVPVGRSGEWKKKSNGPVELVRDHTIINPHITSSSPRKKFSKSEE